MSAFGTMTGSVNKHCNCVALNCAFKKAVVLGTRHHSVFLLYLRYQACRLNQGDED